MSKINKAPVKPKRKKKSITTISSKKYSIKKGMIVLFHHVDKTTSDHHHKYFLACLEVINEKYVYELCVVSDFVFIIIWSLI